MPANDPLRLGKVTCEPPRHAATSMPRIAALPGARVAPGAWLPRSAAATTATAVRPRAGTAATNRRQRDRRKPGRQALLQLLDVEVQVLHDATSHLIQGHSS